MAKNKILRAKKSLGQNFLTSKAVVRDIINATGVSAGGKLGLVLEIGPGKGFLTSELLKNAAEVVVVEKDDHLVEYLKDKFEEDVLSGKLKIIHGDILDFTANDGSPTSIIGNLKSRGYTVVANIPYYITGQILRMFLENDFQPKKMVLMVQKEVAKRIVASDNKESILSISVKAYGTPHYIKKVPARYFNPQPKVDSAILLIDDISKTIFSTNGAKKGAVCGTNDVPPIDGSPTSINGGKLDEKKFFKLMKMGFAHKRKILLNNLSEYEDASGAFSVCGIQPKIRAEKLSLGDWMCLVKNIK